MEQTCEVLKTISQASESGLILVRYTPEIYKLLSCQSPTVRTYALEEIHKAAANPRTLPELLSKVDLVTLVTETVANEELGIAKQAMNILKQIGRNSDGRKMLYSGVILRSIAKLLATNDIIKFRVYEVVVDIAKQSKENLEASVQSGFLQSLISMIDNEDILLQLSALETLTDLATNYEGLNFLEQQGILQTLSEKIAKAHEEPLSNLLIPGLMKFFGHVAKLCPNEIFARYPVVISSLFEVIDGDDPTLLPIALETLGYVSSTIKGKYALQDLGEAMPKAMMRIGEIIKKMPSELRVRGLRSLAGILHVTKAEQDNRIVSLTKSWFDSICEEPLKMIFSICKQPFADIRQASLEVLAVVAAQEWGQEYIANHPGLIEFLLDRNVEAFKDCKDVKYGIVKNLSEAVPNIFDAQTMQKLKQFVKGGPFYVDVDNEVATEGAS